MASLTIERLDDGVYERLKDLARENNRSVEAEVRNVLEVHVLTEDQIEAEKKMRAVIADIAAFRERMKEKHGVQQTDSVALIRAIRAEE